MSCQFYNHVLSYITLSIQQSAQPTTIETNIGKKYMSINWNWIRNCRQWLPSCPKSERWHMKNISKHNYSQWVGWVSLYVSLVNLKFLCDSDISVLLAPDHYCKRKWRWTLLWVVIPFDVVQIQVIERETHFQLGLHAGLIWLTKLGYCSAAAGGHENRFYDFPKSWVGDWPTKGKLKFKNTCK